MGKVVKSFEECGKEIALRLLNEMRGNARRRCAGCWTRVPRDAEWDCVRNCHAGLRSGIGCNKECFGQCKKNCARNANRECK